ncbi:hypothetical protein [uncultured Corynebacterium sp.]|uniref:hypothetical protein n=1 Tax=uncultured Corynebacterium sp. TaxID=159447 RepID=UPI0025CF3396|nr:hypothetical protein [uncultured Corynebacterium sp.]
MRLSTSLVAICATTMALVTPLAAADDSSASASSTATATSTVADEASPESATQDVSEEASEEKAPEESAQEPAKDSSKALGSSLNVGHTSTKDLSQECADQVNQARKDHEAAVADGTAGSSFMGPQELANGVLNGYGSSGMPDTPDCVEEEKEAKLQKDWDEMPEFVQSARPTEKSKEIYAWVGGALALLSVGIRVLVVAAEFDPSILNGLRAFLKSMGFYWDNSKKKEEVEKDED